MITASPPTRPASTGAAKDRVFIEGVARTQHQGLNHPDGRKSSDSCAFPVTDVGLGHQARRRPTDSACRAALFARPACVNAYETGRAAPAVKRSLASRRWDAEYARGRYAGEPPVEFTKTIIKTVAASGLERGLYVGCGNGRNFAALASAGLYMDGIDPSPAAIEQLAARCPSAAGRLWCAELEDFRPGARLDYLVAIQVFQHGGASAAARHFERASELVRPGGALFVRANSASTEVYFGHRVRERTAGGSFTARYDEGPKRGPTCIFSPGRTCSGTSRATASRRRPGRPRIAPGASRQRQARGRSGRSWPKGRDPQDAG